MAELIKAYLPNVYKMGWSGQAGWGTAIYLTLYMTVLSFIIGGHPSVHVADDGTLTGVVSDGGLSVYVPRRSA